jgi:hypothetical protein
MKKGRKQQKATKKVEEENLDRFAGSSDEDEDIDVEEVTQNHDEEDDQTDDDAGNDNDLRHHDADADSYGTEDDDDEDQADDVPKSDEFVKARRDGDGKQVEHDDDDDESSVEGEEVDPAAKMASAMGRILGTTITSKTTKSSTSSSVVLAKTVTPLQRLQQQEKEKQKATKEKRQAMKERNLTALHYPLSIATTNTVNTDGRTTVAKELEQERFHRRVATRGVVALFNAISQHQRSATTAEVSCTSIIMRRTYAMECMMQNLFSFFPHRTMLISCCNDRSTNRMTIRQIRKRVRSPK